VDLPMLPYSTTLLPSQFGFLETTKYNNEIVKVKESKPDKLIVSRILDIDNVISINSAKFIPLSHAETLLKLIKNYDFKLKSEKSFINRFNLDFEMIFERLGNKFKKILLSKADIIKYADKSFDKTLKILDKED